MKKFNFSKFLHPYIKIIFYFFYSLFLNHITGLIWWLIKIKYLIPYYKYLIPPERFYYLMLVSEFEIFLHFYLCGMITIIIFPHLSAIFVGILFGFVVAVSPVLYVGGIEGVNEFYRPIFTIPFLLSGFIITVIIGGIGAAIGTKGGKWVRTKFLNTFRKL